MADCLVTKLKGVVNNDDLGTLGVLRLRVVKADSISSGYQQELNITATGSVVVSVDGDGYFSIGSNQTADPSACVTTTTITDSSKILYFVNDNYNIEISNKYGITELYTHRLYSTKKIINLIPATIGIIPDLSILDFAVTDTTGDLAYLRNLTSLEELELQATKVYGDLSNLSGMSSLTMVKLPNNSGVAGDISSISGLSNLEVFNATGTSIVGDISSLENLSNLVQFVAPARPITGNISYLSGLSNATYINLETTKVSGNIDSLGGLQSITDLNLYNNIVSGTVEGFVSAQVTGGRTSVTSSNAIHMFRLIQYASFGGNRYSAGHCHLTWASSSKIAVYEGNSSLASCTKVYTKGYTQSEAEEAFPGKTIIRVDA